MGTKKLPDDNALLFAVLICDIINILLRETVSLAIKAKEQQGNTILIFSGIMTGILIIFMVLHVALFHFYECAHYTTLLRMILQGTGMILYFVGDNLNYLTRNYREGLPIDKKDLKHASTLLLGIAVLLYYANKECKGVETEMTDAPKSRDILNPILPIVTTLAQIDLIYTVAAGSIGANKCSATKYTFIVFLALCVVVGWASISYKSIKPFMNATNNSKSNLVAAVAIVSYLLLPLYLMADNTLPMDCIFNGNLLHISRLVSASIVFVPLILIAVCEIGYYKSWKKFPCCRTR